jgi:hypothetical protein
MEGYNSPNTPAKNQKVELELISNGPCDNKIDGASTFTNENGYFKINYIGSKCEGNLNLNNNINLISYTKNGLGIVDLYRGIERNKNIKFDTLYNNFKSYSIIRYNDYKTLLDNDTVEVVSSNNGGENKDKYFFGPYETEIFDTITIYSNYGGSIGFTIGFYKRKFEKAFSCPPGKINSYNMVDVK